VSFSIESSSSFDNETSSAPKLSSSWESLLAPSRMDVTKAFESIHAKVGEAAGRAGARVVDLLPAYRGLRWDLLVVDGVDDEHPNEIAHRIAAGAILRVLDDVVPWTHGGPAADESAVSETSHPDAGVRPARPPGP